MYIRTNPPFFGVPTDPPGATSRSDPIIFFGNGCYPKSVIKGITTFDGLVFDNYLRVRNLGYALWIRNSSECYTVGTSAMVVGGDIIVEVCMYCMQSSAKLLYSASVQLSGVF